MRIQQTKGSISGGYRSAVTLSLTDPYGANIFKMKRLSELGAGSVARIHSFEKNDLFLKLMEMGCVPGEMIKVEQIAPLGDPIAISVAGYNLSLRLDEAENIFIEEGVV
jgi:ferrous iron transport protein A